MVAIARDIFRPANSAIAVAPGETGKLDLSGQLVFGTHRSGWRYALEALTGIHNPSGLKFDGYIENTFGWRIDEAAERGEIPYRDPWIGIAHHPQNMPQFMEYRTAPQNVFNNYYMRESLKSCRGIFTLSEYHRDWLMETLGDSVPVHALIHPTEEVDRPFEIENYLFNQNKMILSVGHWLRRGSSLKLLPTSRFPKRWIAAEKYSRETQQAERFAYTFTNELGLEIVGDYGELEWLPHEEYDQLLSENIIFLDYFDCSASNTIVECISRNTPCLVNPLPAIVEYLGSDYPYNYDSLEEAAAKAESFDLIEETFDYLSALDKNAYTRESFRASIVGSEIYRNLPGSFDEAVAAAPVTATFDALADLNIVHGGPLTTDYVFVVCFRNLGWKLVRCLESIARQNTSLSYGVVLIDDCSGTPFDRVVIADLLDSATVPWLLVRNQERKYLCRNLYNAASCLVVNPDAVMIQVDGDDTLAGDNVVDILDQAYREGARMTFGSFNAIGDDGIPNDVKQWLEPQPVEIQQSWDVDMCPAWMHLKTHQKSLLAEVPQRYFLEKNGARWLQTGEDLSVQPKMVELAQGRVKYIEDKLYTYDLSGADHEIKDDGKPDYIVNNLYRLPSGTYIGECLNLIRVRQQSDQIARRQSGRKP